MAFAAFVSDACRSLLRYGWAPVLGRGRRIVGVVRWSRHVLPGAAAIATLGRSTCFITLHHAFLAAEDIDQYQQRGGSVAVTRQEDSMTWDDTIWTYVGMGVPTWN